MTLVLAITDGSAIHIVAESRGMNHPELIRHGEVFSAKVFVLQSSPPILVGVSGGLAHWAEASRAYRSQPNLALAAQEMRRALEPSVFLQTNDAHAIVLGFDTNGRPAGFKIDKMGGRDGEREIRPLVPITFAMLEGGYGIGVPSAVDEARAVLARKKDRRASDLRTIVEAIVSSGKYGTDLQAPVVVETLHESVPLRGESE